jgi:AhpD family alkylhydroperoxidase
MTGRSAVVRGQQQSKPKLLPRQTCFLCRCWLPMGPELDLFKLYLASYCLSLRMSQVTEFNDYRQRMNEKIMAADNKVIKRFFNLDTNAYQEGAVDVKTKEMLGLACSLVLRCDDCVKYHLGKCFEEKLTDEEVYEVFAIANLIGGSIVIPHFRRAVEYWEILKTEAAA